MKTNLQKVRKEAGFRSAKAFAEHMGISPNTYTAFEQGRHALSLEQAWIFADALGEAMGRYVSLDELAGRDWPRIESSLTPAERELLDAYRASDDRGRGNIADTAAREKSASERDVVRVDAGVGIKDNIS